jgi:dihydropyrimidine dehydrogenase (NADP+)
MEERNDAVVKIKLDDDLLSEGKMDPSTRPGNLPQAPVPALKDVIGRSLHQIGTYSQLDNKQQVVAVINDVRT